MLLALLASSAPAAEREPLPASPVERGVTLPRGWSSVEVAGARLASTVGAPDVVHHTLTTVARTAPLGHLELRVAVPVVRAAVDGDGVGAGPGDPTLGAAVRLVRVQDASLAADAAWTAPLGAAPGGVPLGAGVARLQIGLAGGARAGPLRGQLRVAGVVRFPTAVAWRGGVLDAPDGVVAEPAVLLQAGPLFPWADARLASFDRTVDGRIGLGAQLNRAVALRGWIGGALAGEAPLHPAEPRGRVAGLAFEVDA